MPQTPGAAPALRARVLVASNRGPVSYSRDAAGELVAGGGGGGLVSGLAGAALHEDVVWVCAALSDDDRAAAARATATGERLRVETGPAAVDVSMLDVDPATFDAAYNTIANSTLWFVHHQLWDESVPPEFGPDFAAAWAAYVEYNEQFAAELDARADTGARVVVHDYHLALVPALLATRRPDLAVGHFSHTPWAPAWYFARLPEPVREALLRGVLGARRAGFLSARWADAFAGCCAQLPGAVVERTAHGHRVTLDGHVTQTAVHSLGPDPELLRDRAGRPDVLDRRDHLLAVLGGRRALVRVDRAEPSKNIVRGLEAYRELLHRHPEWIGRVVHVVLAYPSRSGLAAYRRNADAVRELAHDIEREFGRPDWTPLVLGTEDDLPGSLAAYRIADVLVVNPVRDGMNLVAKEAPLVSDDGCVLVLSSEAGAVDDLGEAALVIDPFDVVGTAEALHAALVMDAGERHRRHAQLCRAAAALPPARWFDDQLVALAEPAESR